MMMMMMMMMIIIIQLLFLRDGLTTQNPVAEIQHKRKEKTHRTTK
jgi:hypothetical protein